MTTEKNQVVSVDIVELLTDEAPARELLDQAARVFALANVALEAYGIRLAPTVDSAFIYDETVDGA